MLKNDGTNVELISAGHAGSLTLGSEDNVTHAARAYRRIVEILEAFSEQYVNPDYAVVGSGRALGTTASSVPNVVTSYSLAFDAKVSGFPYVDSNYEADVEILTQYNMHIPYITWLGSRGTGNLAVRKNFNLRALKSDGSLNVNTLYCRYSEFGKYKAIRNAVRPIITLKSDVYTDAKIVYDNGTDNGGLYDGSENNPYFLGEQIPLTITFETNGGTEVERKVVVYDTQYKELPTTSKMGQCFAGWYLEPECINRITEESIVETKENHK